MAMRVLHLHSGNLYGGVETFLATLARCRDMTPLMETTVALTFDGPVGAELRAAGVATPMLGEVRLRRPDTVWRARRTLTSLLASEHFDVAVCHQPWPLAIFGSVIKSSGVPLVSWVHMVQRGRHWLERLASSVEPDCIVCNSEFTKLMLPPTSVRVERIYYPLSPRRAVTSRGSVRTSLGATEDDVVVIQVSRMESWKGQQACIKALGMLRDRPDWICWQVGGAQRPAEEHYLASLHAAADHEGISSRVRFLGQRFDVPALLGAADLFCQPNLEPEPFGLSLVEALSAGLPVVTSASGGALEIVDDACGVRLPADDARALAAALGRLISDRATRQRMGNAGPARARWLCDPATQMRRIAEVLEDVSCRHPVH